MQEILWEHTCNGMHAFTKSKRTSSPNNLFRVRNVALKKMDSIRFMSATFSGQQVLFEPLVGILFDYISHADFMGIYGLSDERDVLETPERASLPEFCVRNVSWHQQEDIVPYKQATNKKAYIQSEQAIHATNIFVSSTLYPELLQQMEALKGIIRQGITFDSIQRENPLWDSVRISFSDGAIAMKIYYNLNVQKSLELEAWLTRWHNVFSHIDYSSGMLAEGDFHISYESSLPEMIEGFPA